MNAIPPFHGRAISRRKFLAGSALVVSFAALPRAGEADTPSAPTPAPPKVPIGDMKTYPWLDSWIGIDEHGAVTVSSGKVELGQGVQTAFMQCAAEQLCVDPAVITMQMASTTRPLNEGYTAGSESMMSGANAILQASARMRAVLVGWAAKDLNADVTQLTVENGIVSAPGGQRKSYGDLVKGRSLHVQFTGPAVTLPASQYKIMGKNIPRLDIPDKLTGKAIYVQDIRMKGMLHARVVRPPNYGCTLASIDTGAVERMPGVVAVIRQGDYLAVVAEKEFQAILAMRALQQAAQWQPGPDLLGDKRFPGILYDMKSQDKVILNNGSGPITVSEGVLSATFTRPYVMHASIGPSCAVASYDGEHLTVWTHSQGVYPLRDTIADMLSLPKIAVDCIFADGSGCYGHNGADDVAADAAIIAYALPNHPIRVQWMREDENGWEPYGSSMICKVRGTVGADGMIDGFDYDVWSMSFNTRPSGKAANLMPSWYLPTKFGPPHGGEVPLPSGGGDRNALPTYTLPNAHIVDHYVTAMPMRCSALRGLGGFMNVFAIESFMDELAAAAKTDPVEFRLKHLADPRSRAVVQKAAEEFGWSNALRPGRSRGFAFVRYETFKGYCALAVEVSVDADTGAIRVWRAVAAVDSGNAVNPNGIQNQIIGCIIQATSWTLFEGVTFDEHQVTSRDWSSYPILRFDGVPEVVNVHVINRPDKPFLGTGEAGMGPTPAAIANAVANATGIRLRDLPLTAAKVKAAMLKQT
jgi:nicotinate dehydrogenase subunit B